ncbi:MAG: branched-chain amino acid ABC transporter permease [Alteromonadaceae bacterium]|nr:branched-chain amino acid ABC transporter permease [Alteromonadaceae bacterium]
MSAPLEPDTSTNADKSTRPTATEGNQPGFRYISLWPWAAVVVAALVLPLIFSSGHSVDMLSQMGILAIFALSYNMLLGNTGLLSFGHAVYFGLGGFCTMHVLRMVNEAGTGLPLELLPLVGAFSGLGFGIIFGAVSTRRAGVVFAMITLGIGALVHSSSLMFTNFFGGEGGLFGNRVQAPSLFGVDYGPSINVYYLIVAWTLISAIAMFALRRTPLGWMANAVRDNPERAQFVGYNPQMVRFIQFSLSAFFAGLAGGLFILADEIITDETVGQVVSGQVLLATYLGGIGYFFGPIFGAILVTYLETSLSSVTEAWVLYFGLMFIAVVMFAPQGLFGLLHQQLAAIRAGQWKGTTLIRLYLLATTLIAIFGLVCVVELAYHYFGSWDPSAPMNLMGLTVNVTNALPWLVSLGISAVGLALMNAHARPLLRRRAAATSSGGEQ